MHIGKQEKKIYVSKIIKSYIKYLNGGRKLCFLYISSFKMT